MIGAVVEREPCRRFPPLFNRDAFLPAIFNIEDPIAFRTAELNCWARLGIGNHVPH